MSASLCPWQYTAWTQWQNLQVRLPHAVLFHGPQGIGKTTFAERCAQWLLCEAPATDGHPCGQCDACGWFAKCSHPDHRLVRPEAMEDGSTTESDDGDSGTPADAKKSKVAKTPSKDIKIDQIRALSDFMNISTHRTGLRVIVLYPAEALNAAAANSLLKMLEEPPSGTIFLLVTNRLERLLPTILSRCWKFALAMPERAVAGKWLSDQHVPDAENWLAEQGGAPLAALASAQSGTRAELDDFLQQLTHPGVDTALKTAERLQKASLLELVSWMQRWLYDMLCFKFCGRIRYYPRYRKEFAALVDRVEASGLLRAIKDLNDRRAIAAHPLAPRLFIEDMLLDYSTLFVKGP